LPIKLLLEEKVKRFSALFQIFFEKVSAHVLRPTKAVRATLRFI